MEQDNWNQQYQQPIPPYGYREPEHKGFAIASLVLGILSIVLCCIYGGFLGILGLIFGIVSLAKKESKMGMAIAGIITSALGLIYAIMMVMATVMTIKYGISEMDEETLFRMAEQMYGIESVEPENDLESESTEDTIGDNHTDFEENPFEEKTFVLEDGTAIYFQSDGTFVWYQDDTNHDDNYTRGSYDVYRAEFAESYIMSYLGEYGMTQEELADLYESKVKKDNQTEENFTCLVLHNESAIKDGAEQIIEPYDTNYMGFYNEGQYDAVDMTSEEIYTFRAS